MDPLAGTSVGAGPGSGSEGSGPEAAETAGTVLARRSMRARISPVGVAELKCIRPRGVREAASPGIFSGAVV